MTTIRATFAKWVFPGLAVLLILLSLGWLGIWAAPALLLGIVGGVTALCALCAS